jgi:hypothetical protein
MKHKAANVWVGHARQWVRDAIAGWSRFWFEAESGPQMRVFRTGFAFLLLINYLIRSIDLELFYSDHGLVRLSVLDELVPMKFRYSVFQLFPGTTALWIGNTIFLVSLLLLGLGIYPRLSAFVASVLHISFLHRNIGAGYGMDAIATFYLLYLCLADYRDRPAGFHAQAQVHTAHDNHPHSPEHAPAPAQDIRSVLGSMAFRLAQIQLCVIYGYSGLHKLKGVYWWKGEGVWSVLANFQMARFDFTWASHFPALLTAMSFTSLFWEVYFPALIWIRPLRYPFLVFGVLFHLGIGIAISIPFFAMLMILIYILFIDASHCAALERFFRSRIPYFHFFRKGFAGHTEEIIV